mgnify:FL=1
MGCNSSKASTKNLIDIRKSQGFFENELEELAAHRGVDTSATEILRGVTFYWYPSSAQCRSILMLMLELQICPEKFVMIDLINFDQIKIY